MNYEIASQNLGTCCSKLVDHESLLFSLSSLYMLLSLNEKFGFSLFIHNIYIISSTYMCICACVRVCIYKNNILNQTFEKIRNFLSFLSSQFSRELIIYTILEEFFIPIKKGGSINTQVATS